jgi:hypothetical protein
MTVSGIRYVPGINCATADGSMKHMAFVFAIAIFVAQLIRAQDRPYRLATISQRDSAANLDRVVAGNFPLCCERGIRGLRQGLAKPGSPGFLRETPQ